MKKIILGLLLLLNFVSAYSLNVHQTTNSSRPTPLMLYRFNDVNVTDRYFDELNYCNVSTASGGLGSKGGLYPALSFTNGTSLWTDNFLNSYFPYLAGSASSVGCSSQYANYNLTSGTFDFYTFSNSSLRPVGAATEYIWRDTSGHFQILANSAANNLRFVLFSPADGGTCDFISSFSISDNVLHRHTFAFYKLSNGNTNGTYYFDGIYNQSNICLNTIQNNGTAFNIGGIPASSNAFEGLIEEFAYFNANYTPNRIDGIAQNCYDGTLNGTCSTVNLGWYCNEGTPEINLNYCPCSSTQIWNGTSCAASSTISKNLLPVDLYVSDLGICLLGEDCPIFGLIPADLLQVKYLVNKKLIGNLSTLGTDTNIVLANNATCSLIDLNPDLTETGFTSRLTFNQDTQVWENNDVVGFSNKIVKISCESEIPNTKIWNYFLVRNTRLNKDIYAVASAGLSSRLDNRITDRETPVFYRLQTNNYYRPNSDSCELELNGTEFYSQNGEDFDSGLISSSNFITWDKTIKNIINFSGEFPYNWTCINGNNFRVPSIKLFNSLVNTQTCSNGLSSKIEVKYVYDSNSYVNVSNTYYYGTDIFPLVSFKSKNVSTTSLTNFECSLDIYNYSNNDLIKSFDFQTDKGVAQYGTLDFDEYTNGFLPVSNYSFIYSCRNKEVGLCITPSTLNNTIYVINTPASCLGTQESCGINSCEVCPPDSFTCELGAVNITQSCFNQKCGVSGQEGINACLASNRVLYSLKLTVPTNNICGKDVPVKVSTLKLGTPFNANASVCIVEIYDENNVRLNTHNIGANVNYAGESFYSNGIDFSTSFSELPCGSNLTVKGWCESSLFVPNYKEIVPKNIIINPNILCAYNDTIVSQGCVFETTKNQRDKPYYCNVDESISLNSKICGCPVGQKPRLSGNSTLIGSCVDSNLVSEFNDWIFSGRFLTITNIILFIIAIGIILLLIKLKTSMNYPYR